MLPCLIQHGIIRIIDRIKGKTISGISHIQLLLKAACLLFVDLLLFILNFLITAFAGYLLRDHDFRLTGREIFGRSI